MITYRSPGCPPRNPPSPSPATLSRDPVSTPGGICILRFFSALILPCPWHALQGFLIVWPSPLQEGQLCLTLKNPCDMDTCPLPLQREQVSLSEPASHPFPEHFLQVSSLGILIFFISTVNSVFKFDFQVISEV